MRISLIFLLALGSFLASAQDEGPAVAKARFDRPYSVTAGGGISRTLGKNVGDYSKGTNLEVSFLKRLNKIVSVGGYVSRIQFGYDPSKTPSSPKAADLYKGFDSDLRIRSTENVTYKQQFGAQIPVDYDFPHGFQLSLSGGDVSLTTIGANLKFNLIPVLDKIPVSIYVFAKPFVALASRADVNGTGTMYLYEATVQNGKFVITSDDQWYKTQYEEEWGSDGYPVLGAENSVTGGLLVGPGVELMPSGPVSFFIQSAFGYTMPVSFVSTSSYPLTTGSYTNPKFPIIKKGFPSLSLQAGLALNF